MDGNDTRLHAETDAARAGSTPHIVRWILAISLLAAIVLLSIVWITGALTQDKAESQATASGRIEAATPDTSTDSIVTEGANEIDAAPAGGDSPADDPGRLEN